MPFSRSFLSEEQFLCSICLEVFTNPASTPCGHSFCMACISRYWDGGGAKHCQCPLCKETFKKRPDLQINRTLREITEQFKAMTGGSSGDTVRQRGGGGGGGGGGEGEGSRKGDMPGDLFAELTRRLPHGGAPPPYPHSTITKMPSSSYLASVSLDPQGLPIPTQTQTQLSPPGPPGFRRSSSRRRFTLSGAAADPQSLPVCGRHRRGLLVYCRTDRECICVECETTDHQSHDTVSLEREWQDNKTQLAVSEAEIQELIRQREGKIEEIRTSLAELQLAVESETAGSVCVFSALVSAVERSQAELMEVLEMSRRAAEHHGDAAIRQLEQEVTELKKRSHALSELAQSEDYVDCIKSFPALSTPPPMTDWSGVAVTSDLGTGAIYRSLSALVERFQTELRKMADNVFPAPAEPSPVRPQPKVKRIQEYAEDITLDSSTAHPRLILSEDRKKVKCGERHQQVPDNPERFDRVVCVLGREAFTSGRHYWEVEVGGKTDWDLGVASHSISRKGKILVTPGNGYWFLSLRKKNNYAFRSEPATELPLSLRPQKIGVYVDYEKGQVSFYNVDAKLHIYTFLDSFSESVFPFFSPCTNSSGKNDGPLTITPVGLMD